MTKQEQRWHAWMHFFAPTCHQKAERSFFYRGWQFPVCARCTGLYVGYLIGLLFACGDVYLPLWLDVCFLTFMFIDWYLQHKTILMSTNIRRCFSGLCAGIAMLQLLAYGIHSLLR